MNEVIQVIKLLLKGYKNNKADQENALVTENNGKSYYIWNCDYLLNQVIRHYDIPQERYYYSKAAKELWKSLGFDIKDLKTKYYREQITSLNNNVRCLLFKGSASEPYKQVVNKGDVFPFNDAFHLEHVIPISKIIDELSSLDNPDDAQIEAVLNKLCVARITKEEDRSLHNKNKREGSFDKIYNNLYKEKNIVLFNNDTDKQI